MIINENGVSREMTADEEARMGEIAIIDAPSQLDLIGAQILYTALMTDTLIKADHTFEVVRYFYGMKIYSAVQVYHFVDKSVLTAEQYNAIVGE